MAGWILAGGGFDQPAQLVWLLIGGSLLYTGGMFLNDAADAKWDREHRSERPIATGRVGEKSVWVASVLFLVVGFTLAVLPGGADWRITVALVAAIVTYDLYHKPWKGSVIIMGACRVLLYLMAGSAVVGGVDWQAHRELIIKAIALGGYVVGLSLVARSEAVKDSGGGVFKILGVVGLYLPFIFMNLISWHLSAVIIFCYLLYFFFYGRSQRSDSNSSESKQKGFSVPWDLIVIAILLGPTVISVATIGVGDALSFHLIMKVLSAILLAILIHYALHWMTTPPLSNIGKAVGLLLASIPVVDALAIAPHAPWLALAFVGCMPLLRLWQRKISAT